MGHPLRPYLDRTAGEARSSSLSRQLEALGAHAARGGYEDLEEVMDSGEIGASLVRAGMDRMRHLVAAGGVSAVPSHTPIASLESPGLTSSCSVSSGRGADGSRS